MRRVTVWIWSDFTSATFTSHTSGSASSSSLAAAPPSLVAVMNALVAKPSGAVCGAGPVRR
eukprot:5099695-Prymnesium_polylepis.1